MRIWIVLAVAAFVFALAALTFWRQRDRQADARAWDALVAAAGPGSGAYSPAMVEALPEPAQRYFNYMIEPGAPLQRVVEIEMAGQLGLGTREKHRYDPMRARQILAPPHGLVWQLNTPLFGGSDGALPERSWTRFWFFGLLPFVRVGGADHRRSAFGRVVAEAAFWVPASLLPGARVRWEALDDDSARAIVRHGAFEQAVDITVDEDGAPREVLLQRWSNENADREYREQPFGGVLSSFKRFGGYRLPTCIEGGNHFGTDSYFPFFKANVTNIRFPAVESSRLQP